LTKGLKLDIFINVLSYERQTMFFKKGGAYMSSKEKRDIYEVGERIKKANKERKEAEEKLNKAIKDIEKYTDGLKEKPNQIIPINGIKIDIKSAIKGSEQLAQKNQKLLEVLSESLVELKY
jgi:seryl-tRNA synthetase